MNSSTTNEQNEYAKDITGKVVYILDVERGQKDYWCMSCGHEMQAIHRTIEHYKPYFRHVAEDVKIVRKCTFSNQEYRHKLAIEILQFTKRIKVPNLYSYSPDGNKAVLLEEAKFIEANHVRAKLTFYEDDDGNVLHGKNPDLENKNLLIRPDLTFFNNKEEPILLIEIVVSHKLDDEKKVKLRRLGINTIQIVIPKDSEENIAKSLQTSINTKWVYNDVQQRTDYLQVSKGNREDLSPIDELQRQFFEESIACRKSQIGNLIRSISRCLEGQQYRNLILQLEQELSRVKTNTDQNRERLGRLRSEHRERVSERFRDSYEILEREESEFEQSFNEDQRQLYEKYNREQTDIESRYANLEGRYLAKNAAINQEQSVVDREIELRYRIGKSEEEIRREFESEEARIDNELSRIKREQGYIVDEIQSESRFEENFEGDKLRIEDEESQLEQEFAGLERQEREGFESLRKKFQSNEGTNGEFTKFTIEERIRSEFEREHQQVIERVSNRDVQSNDELSERIKTILELRGVLDDYNDEQAALERYRKGRAIIESGTYKEWDK